MRPKYWKIGLRFLTRAVLPAGVVVLLLLLPLPRWRGASDGSVRFSGGGVPLALLWTMMRSGSSLTQKLLSAQKCSFLTEEPLRDRLTEGINASLDILQNLLACQISTSPDLVEQWVDGLQGNVVYLRAMCHNYPTLCKDGKLLDAICQASCFRLVRVVGRGLSLALIFLQDHGSNAHVVHLVRDPRAVISSRWNLSDSRFIMVRSNKRVKFFHKEELDVAIVCQRYRHDLAVAMHLARHNPDR